MLLFTVLLIAFAILLLGFAVVAAIGGLAFIVAYGDVIVFVWILSAIIVWLIRRRRNR